DGGHGALAVSYVGINGTVYASSATPPTNAGQYRASATFAGDTSHTGSSGFADFTINKANQTITWATPAPIAYGTVLGAGQLNATVAGVTGGTAPGALTYSPAAGTLLSPGARTLSVSAAATANYNAATAQ